MLSYRHAFHAGNHADILKHYCLISVLEYFKLKDKAYCYIDTHAGAGLYSLNSKEAQKVGEYREGIKRILDKENLDTNLQTFREVVIASLPDTENYYCGSPWLAQAVAREQDRLRLFELHPTDAELLRSNMRNIKLPNRAQVFCDDGFKGLLSMLPPPSRRAVVLIDPPYEVKHDYQQVVDTLKAAIKKFSNGCYMVWYPCLGSAESQKLPMKLQKLVPDNFVQVELHVKSPQPDGFGMHGSGMFIINPPYTLPQQLAEVLPALTQLLAQDNSAHFVLQSHIA